jgi:hypothetical protein
MSGFLLATLVVLTFLTGPILQYQQSDGRSMNFLFFDDRVNYGELIRGEASLSFLWERRLGMWEPAANACKLILATITGGVSPLSVLVTSVLVHAVNTILLAALVTPAGTTKNAQPIWWQMLVFLLLASWALHPLRVEVVRWASCLPYSLALLGYLLSLRFIHCSASRPFLAFVCLLFAFLCKIATLPLLVHWLWQLNVPVRRPLLSVMAGGTALLLGLAQAHAALSSSTAGYGYGGVRSLSSLISDMLLAINWQWHLHVAPFLLCLRPIYSRHDIGEALQGYLSLLLLVAVLLVVILLLRRLLLLRDRQTFWLWMSVALAWCPALALYEHGMTESVTTDRYAHLPSALTILVLIQSSRQWILTHLPRWRTRLLVLMPLLLLLTGGCVVLMHLSTLQLQRWENDATLWEEAIHKCGSREIHSVTNFLAHVLDNAPLGSEREQAALILLQDLCTDHYAHDLRLLTMLINHWRIAEKWGEAAQWLEQQLDRDRDRNRNRNRNGNSNSNMPPSRLEAWMLNQLGVLRIEEGKTPLQGLAAIEEAARRSPYFIANWFDARRQLQSLLPWYQWEVGRVVRH